MKRSKKKTGGAGETTTGPSEMDTPEPVSSDSEGAGPDQDGIDAIRLLQYGVIALVFLLVVGYALRNFLHII